MKRLLLLFVVYMILNMFLLSACTQQIKADAYGEATRQIQADVVGTTQANTETDFPEYKTV